MYRNLGNIGRVNPTSNRDSGSSHTAGSIPASQGTSNSTTQHEQKFAGASDSEFVPSLNAITSNQDLQWLVQPSFIATSSSSISPRPSYPTVFGVRPLRNYPTQTALSGVIRETVNSGGSTRRRSDEHLSPEELERRRVRRERNKQAAAKCRNRRRELTDTLQNETDQLEDDKARLQKEIDELQKEKEKLELVLEAHRPMCKIEDTDSDSDAMAELPSSSLVGIKREPGDQDHQRPSIKSKPVMDKAKPKIKIPAKPVTSACAVLPEGESLHTPIVTSTPSLATSLIFTYPCGSLETNALALSQTSLLSQQCGSQLSRIPEPCSIAHRRSSSSGDQSDHSLNSPTIFTL